MRILVGKCFGLGNAVLTIPLIKALSTLGQVDVLVGSGPDDNGALEVFSMLRHGSVNILNGIYVDTCPAHHDVAIMAIPFDGRWKNGIHFNATTVLDERKRPGNVERLGFDMWEKHEVEYQMESARELGYVGETPSSSFISSDPDSDLVYVGIGYKRDAGGFGASKNFGTERFADLMQAILKIRPNTKFISTGSMTDLIQVGAPLMRSVRAYGCNPGALTNSWPTFQRCGSYIGNDTGAMHVAASMGIPTYGLMAYHDLATKNPPFTSRGKVVVFTRDFPGTEFIAKDFADFVWGQR